MMPDTKKAVIDRLQKELLLLQGIKMPSSVTTRFPGLDAVEAAFPNAVFPTGAIHEFLNAMPEHAAASNGFIAGLLATLMQNGGVCLWISASRILFPPALRAFGVEPDRIIFVDLKREKDVLWAAEEALKCGGLAAVVAEMREINFAQSRRLQLAVEKSRVTGFILRSDPGKISATACVARWKITPVPSVLEEDMPGVGFPRWNVELLKVRNGSPGNWKVEWLTDGFSPVTEKVAELVINEPERMAG